MARRASSSLHPAIILGVIAAVVIAFFAGKLFLGKKASSFSHVAPLDVQEFLENGNSLRDNEYVIEGQVDERFTRPSSRGQVVSVRVQTRSGEELIPVEIPADFRSLNIEREQRYAFRVKFRQGGIPVTTGVNRL